MNQSARPVAASAPARPTLSIIAAVARNRVIGKDNGLPWRLPEDLRRFRAITTGHPIIMGRRTHQSLGRPLPERRNIVISRDPDFTAAGCEVAPSLEKALELCTGTTDEVFVIGGAELYAAALPDAQRLYLTEVDLAPEGDTLLPQVDAGQWREVAREPGVSGSGIGYAFVRYERA